MKTLTIIIFLSLSLIATQCQPPEPPISPIGTPVATY